MCVFEDNNMARWTASFVLVMTCLVQGWTQSAVPLMHAVQSVRDQDGNNINAKTPGSTLVFDSAKQAIFDPAGQQLTLDKFNAAQGFISVKCVDVGTRTILRLWGLVPHGTYTMGLTLMGAIGGGPVAMGALSDDPKGSVVVADASGQADLTVTRKPGPLSRKGKVGQCYVADFLDKIMEQPVAQVVGYYHVSNKPDAPAGGSVPQFMFTFPRMMRLNNEIVDKGGKPIVDSTPSYSKIFEFRKKYPILAPARGEVPLHRITVGEFRRVAGAIVAQCNEQGTQVSMSLTGLIPHGTYSVWVAKPDASDPTHMKMMGVGALGKNDGSQNTFTADGNGDGYLTATNPGGTLSTFGSIANCWLTGEPMVQVAGVYHIDGATHGPVVGPDGTYVGQFAFVFMGMQPLPPSGAMGQN